MNLCGASALLLLAAAVDATAANSDAVSAVDRLYRDYAWEAVMASPGRNVPGLMQESRATLERYFDHALTDLIVKDNECTTRTHEICNLDFLPIWSGQDPAASDLTVSPTGDPTVVNVQFHHPAGTDPIKLTFILAKSAAGWRITDIKGDKWDLLEVLRGKP